MHIEILGTVCVTVGGQEREIRSNKVRAMFATLALEPGRAISHLELADELWSGQPLGNVHNALQAHAARLRKILEGPSRGRAAGTVLRAVHNGYVLDIPHESVDGNRFLDLAARGSAALRHDPCQAIELLESGLRLWRGPALLDAGDGLRCKAAAALFDERRLTLWEDLVSARLAVGDVRQAAAELRPLVAQHPLNEHLCAQLMTALYRSGRQGEALTLYHRTRRRLDEDLGVQPGLFLQQRYAEILAQDPALTLTGITEPSSIGRIA
ncbi:BTAD domain-containing putative transcriptional regulator [Streptomyces sp. MMS24-I31]|uniref:AfsR/SARP family transcriptional regulator n=1 Tax=Streptomyces sp. MMS24-I31 TaxID=3351563 RepID=UPI003896EDBC